jgi:hypothetical protein
MALEDMKVNSLNEALKDYVAWVVDQKWIRPKWYVCNAQDLIGQLSRHFDTPIRTDCRNQQFVNFPYAGVELSYTQFNGGRFSLEEEY